MQYSLAIAAEARKSWPVSRSQAARYRKRARMLDLGGHVGELKRDSLELADRAGKLRSILRMRKRSLERPLGGTQAHGGDSEPAGVERLERGLGIRPPECRGSRQTVRCSR